MCAPVKPPPQARQLTFPSLPRGAVFEFPLFPSHSPDPLVTVSCSLSLWVSLCSVDKFTCVLSFRWKTVSYMSCNYNGFKKQRRRPRLVHPGLAPPSEMKLVVKLLGDAEVVLGELIRRFNSVLFVFVSRCWRWGPLCCFLAPWASLQESLSRSQLCEGSFS